MNALTQKEFDAMVKTDNLEVFTPEQLKAYVDDAYAEINKSTDKANLESEVAMEVRSFVPITVWNKPDGGDLQKSIKLVRPAQIQWDEPNPDDIEKSRVGTYLDTPQNRKMGRVGTRYGDQS